MILGACEKAFMERIRKYRIAINLIFMKENFVVELKIHV
jgi:hypothetical protein